MGITFRSGDYHQRVVFSGRTIKDGEAVAIWNSKGVHTQIIGPRRKWLIGSTIRFLDRFKAESHQYIKVSHRDGRIEHIRGPVTMFHNPAYHDNMIVCDGYRLCSASEFLVVFTSQDGPPSPQSIGLAKTSEESGYLKKKETSSGTKVEEAVLLPGVNSTTSSTRNDSQRIIKGPTLFFPCPNEYIHTFSWSDITSSTSLSAFPQTNFQILITSRTLSLDHLTIPTADGYSLDAKLLLDLKYKLDDSDVRIIHHRDPMEILHQGLLVDAQRLGDTVSSDALLRITSNGKRNANEDDSQDTVQNELKLLSRRLASLSSYPQLTAAANRCGFEVEALRVVSLKPCDKLRVVENRAEMASQAQAAQMKAWKREEQRRDLEEESALRKKKILMDDEMDQESHQMQTDALERRLTLQRREAEANSEIQYIKEERMLKFLTHMKTEMDVDMTKFMTSAGGMATAKDALGKSDVLKLCLDTATASLSK